MARGPSPFPSGWKPGKSEVPAVSSVLVVAFTAPIKPEDDEILREFGLDGRRLREVALDGRIYGYIAAGLSDAEVRALRASGEARIVAAPPYE